MSESKTTLYSIFRLLAVMILVTGLAACQPQTQAQEITVYKSATCGCCKKWVRHLQDNGYKVIAINVADIKTIKTKQGVPGQLASCHTALVDGYVIEGHVPAADIKRLLSERPKTKGIAVPGMPMGSPGMKGMGRDKYAVLTFNSNGSTGVFKQH
ncbi:MAG TPA: DUF411 domain-containing protein [Acidiferrobacteraceae bacterium]|nr:DUF411 domain-containing protein [Acidiferrobacteraceae bacterium]